MKVVKAYLSLSQLKLGEIAKIISFEDETMALKLLEMGCIPGETIKLERIAPMGDPIAIRVSGYLLSLRKAEAAAVMVEKVISTNSIF